MLYSCVTLAIAFFALSISFKLTDEIFRLLMNLVGFLSLFLSLVHTFWLIQLLIVLTIFVIPSCPQPQSLRQPHCSSSCTSRPICPYFPS